MYFLDYRYLGFVPLLAALYWLAGSRARNWVLLLGNIAWLCVFSWSTLIALAGLSLFVILPAAQLAAGAKQAQQDRRAITIAWIGVGVLIALAIALRVRSYFLADLELSESPLASQLLHWIGFSYFLLKGIHVMFASARGIISCPSPIVLLHYVLFLPTLTSGPIYRLDTFEQQLDAPKSPSWDDLQDGLLRVLIGMGKKVVLVPFLTSWALDLHGGGLAKQPAAFVTTYVMLFVDFSGYSDIAIGIGRLFGFAVPENFKSPFTATTLTQFWRNWHATLGDWLRENIFIPLGGVRAKGWHLSLIVLFSMLVVGVWHGFHYMFFLWGLYHGTMLLLENRLGVRPLQPHRTPKWKLVLRYAIVQAIVVGGMFIFIGWEP